MAASPDKAVMLLWHTNALLGGGLYSAVALFGLAGGSSSREELPEHRDNAIKNVFFII